MADSEVKSEPEVLSSIMENPRPPDGKLGMTKAEIARRHELFILHYARTGKAKDSVIAAGYSPKAADVMAAKLMRNPNIGPIACAKRQAAVEDAEKILERQANQLRQAADDAIKTLLEVAKATDGGGRGAQARVQAAVAILDRAGHKPVERVQSDVSLQDAAKQIDDETARSILEDQVFSRYDGIKAH